MNSVIQGSPTKVIFKENLNAAFHVKFLQLKFCSVKKKLI